MGLQNKQQRLPIPTSSVNVRFCSTGGSPGRYIADTSRYWMRPLPGQPGGGTAPPSAAVGGSWSSSVYASMRSTAEGRGMQGMCMQRFENSKHDNRFTMGHVGLHKHTAFRLEGTMWCRPKRSCQASAAEQSHTPPCFTLPPNQPPTGSHTVPIQPAATHQTSCCSPLQPTAAPSTAACPPTAATASAPAPPDAQTAAGPMGDGRGYVQSKGRQGQRRGGTNSG